MKEQRTGTVQSVCWALAGKRAGSIKNVLFGVEDARLSERQGYHCAEHVLLSPAVAAAANKPHLVPLQPLFIATFHSIWCIVGFPSGPTEHYINLCTHTSPLGGGQDGIWPFLPVMV